MLNRVVLVGRMVRDPELRRTGNGTPVASFTIAMNRNFASQNGERQADFIPCVVWNKAAENTARYCGKGSLVGVEGRLQNRSYDVRRLHSLQPAPPGGRRARRYHHIRSSIRNLHRYPSTGKYERDQILQNTLCT